MQNSPPPNLRLIVYFAVLLLFFNSLSMTVQGQTLPPNDPASSQLNGYDNPIYWVGDPAENTSVQYLNLRAAWALTKGDPNVRVAIISNGNDWGQTDMPNPNNYLGYNFVDGNTNTSVNCNPYHPYHGTQMTSLICSKTNNGSGIFGVAGGWTQNGVTQPGVTPIFIKNAFYDPATHTNVFPNSSLASLPACLYHAIANGAKVILIAENFDNPDPLDVNNFNNAIEDILSDPCNQVTIITSAGDWNPNNSSTTSVKFPATNSQIISVAGVDSDHFIWNKPLSGGGSCFGPDVDFVTSYIAPGNLGTCFSTTNPYSTTYGTAVSAALLAGVVSLMYSVNPTLTHQDVIDILKESCYQTSNYNFVNNKSDIVGYGFPNAYTAIQLAKDYLGGIVIDDTRGWPSTNPYVPSNHTTGNIIIKSTGRLTLNAMNLGIATGKSIIIEPGGKLIVNNSIITNACLNKPWKGIQVWGNKGANQLINAYGNYQQGYLELNGSTIENAICAADLWKPNDYMKTGGIIKATNSTFRNNTNSIHALHYRNSHPTQPSYELDYNGMVVNCTFEITSAYIPANTFYKHIDLANIRGFSFLGTDFSLAQNVPGVSESNQAIGSYSAGFHLMGICTSGNSVPCTSYNTCKFTGFKYGIFANNPSNNLYTFNINEAEFISNEYGIRVNKITNPIVLNSHFQVGYGLGCPSKSGYGIYLEQSSGFAIENNDFTKLIGAPAGYYSGILVDNCQSIDEIYGNTFTGLSYANLAQNINYKAPYVFDGLTYFCNKNYSNWADFYVKEDLDDNKTSGISSYQGNDALVTGNKLTQNGARWHFYNGGDYLVGYYYNQNQPDENPYDNPDPNLSKIYHVTDKPKQLSNSCPSHYGGGGGIGSIVLNDDEKQSRQLQYAEAFTNFTSVKTLYDNLKDGGSTDQKIADIATAMPQDMWALRAELLGASPHLTREVLQIVADRTDVFSESVIFDILAANPDELKKDDLIKYMEDKENPLPDYMIDILRLMAEGTTYKTVLQLQMSQYNREKSRAANDMIRSILFDTVADNNQLRNWLDNLGGPVADRQIIASYLQENNFTAALSLADIQPQLYELNESEIAANNALIDIITLYQTLYNDNRQLDALSETEKGVLTDLASQNPSEARALARGILNSFYGAKYDECFDIPETAAYKKGQVNPEIWAQIYGLEIEVNPNPASTWAAFDFRLPETDPTAQLEITDLSGSKVYSVELQGLQGQYIIDTRTIANGMYLYTVTSGKASKTGKLVISK